MSLVSVCPDCGGKIKTPEHLAGKMLRCPKCEAEVRAAEPPDDDPPEVIEVIQSNRPGGKDNPAERIGTRTGDDDEAQPKRRRRERDEEDEDEAPRRRVRRRDRDDDDEDDDDTPALIPYKNPKALIAYYTGVFSLIPFLGLLLGPVALVFGILGKRYANANPRAKGGGHAIAGIVLGALTTIGNWGVLIGLLILWAIESSTYRQKRSEVEPHRPVAAIMEGRGQSCQHGSTNT
jgi:hypothetical protein